MQIKLLVPANLAFSSGVRDISKEAATLVGFDDKDKNLIRLVIDELFMNAVRYGSDDKSHIFVEILDHEGKLICAIEDEGKGESKIKAEALKKIIEEKRDEVSLDKEHGRGLAQITTQLVSAFDVFDKEDGGLRIEFAIEKGQAEAKSSKNKPKAKSGIEEKILPEKTVRISGSIDLSNLQEIITPINEVLEKYKNKPFRLILDFTKLDYCNSTFLGCLAEWHSKLDAYKGEVVVRNPKPNVKEILDLVGLSTVLRIKYDADDIIVDEGEKQKSAEEDQILDELS